MQRKSCKTLLTIRNFQKKCERALAKRQSAIENCKLQMANPNPAIRFTFGVKGKSCGVFWKVEI